MAEPTAAQRKMFAKMGLSMPDGSYYIRNGPTGVSDLDNAVKAVGRGETDDPSSGDPIRRHIIKRARALKKADMIPDTWNPDGSLKHFDNVEDFLAHYGVKGMHWRNNTDRDAQIAKLNPDQQKHVKGLIHAAHQAHLAHLAHLKHLKDEADKAHAAHMNHLSNLVKAASHPSATASKPAVKSA